MESIPFKDRADAAQQLLKVIPSVDSSNTVVLGIPRGGVPVAAQVARSLKAPMDLMLVRKLASPENPEYALGAVSLDRVWIEEPFNGKKTDLDRWVDAERRILLERNRLYRKGKPNPELRNKTVILVDDGIATGRTLLLAIQLVRAQHPQAIWVAVPVSSPEAARRIRSQVNRFFCVQEPTPFYGVGRFYESFDPVDDETVVRTLVCATTTADHLKTIN